MACCCGVQHNEEMDEDEARRRFEAARVGRLATVTPNRMPHLVPVVFALVDDFLYTAVDDKPKTTVALQRLANIDATGGEPARGRVHRGLVHPVVGRRRRLCT